MTKLTIGTTDNGTFSIEADAFATKAAAFIGIRGSGKTYGAMKVAESLYDAGKQFVAIDPVGVWWSLRLSAAKGAGLNVTIFGGLHGDIPLNKNGGALIKEYPQSLTKGELATEAGASATSSAFSNNVSALRSIGLIDYPQQGHVIAKPLLFLD